MRTLRALLHLGAGIAFVRSSAASSCVPVATWAAFQAAVNRHSDPHWPLVFCPFVLSKPTSAKLTITKRKKIECDKPNGCILKGRGTHLVIAGSNAKVSVSDFVFHGATSSAVVVSATSRQRHVFRNCDFLFNKNRQAKSGSDKNDEDYEWGGGAIRAEQYTKLSLLDCDFYRNQGVEHGGAVFFIGQDLVVRNCNFAENDAIRGGAVYKGINAGRVKLVECDFYKNRDTNNDRSPAVYAVNMDRVIVQQSAGSNNSDCNGIYIGTTRNCIPFKRAAFDLGNLNLEYNGVRFSQGIVADVIAASGHPVPLTSSHTSSPTSDRAFHGNPDGAAIVPIEGGGFVYVSNAELDVDEGGGVYALEFDSQGLIRNYRKLLSGKNFCSGGLTPWNTFVSCEEYPGGQCWQVHPQGLKTPRMTVIGGKRGGQFEAFAVDDRDPKDHVFFVTEDKSNGAIRRFRPSPGTPMGWNALHGNGTLDYLVFHPGNRFSWSPSIRMGRKSASDYYWNVEGALHHNGKLMFVSKVQKELFILDLDRRTYTTESTETGKLPGGGRLGAQPDQLTLDTDGLLFFTEDGGDTPGVYAYDGKRYRTLAQAVDSAYRDDETTGVHVSPDGMWLFFCFQEIGYMFRARRIDGKPFEGRHVLKWKYVLGADRQ
jgi:hypothetical protein